MNQNIRLDWVDAAKGISILLVVMMYAATGAGEATNNIGALHYVIGFATPFRMPEFFLISGLFLANVIARPWAKFVDRRVVHYLYFYALWALIHIVLKIGLASGDPIKAMEDLAWAVVQPYGVLWFIYVLALTSVATKILMELRIPHWVALLGAAALNLMQIDTASYAWDQFARYFVFFYTGYACAPFIFKLVNNAIEKPKTALLALFAWVAINGYLVFTPNFLVAPGHFTMGIAENPFVKITLALIGALAICVVAGLISNRKMMGWLNYIGKNSLVIYVAFVLPLWIARTILLKFNIITDTTLLSVVTMLIALTTPLIGYWFTQRIRFGGFLFTRPAWASIPKSPQKSDHSIKYGSPAE